MSLDKAIEEVQRHAAIDAYNADMHNWNVRPEETTKMIEGMMTEANELKSELNRLEKDGPLGGETNHPLGDMLDTMTKTSIKNQLGILLKYLTQLGIDPDFITTKDLEPCVTLEED